MQSALANLRAVSGPLDFGPLLVLEPEERARLAAASTSVRFSAGATIVREGESADAAYALTSGRVRVAAGPNGRTLRTLAAPVLVGEMAILSGQPRNASVTAIVSCRALRIPAVALRAAISASAAFASTLDAFALVRHGTHFLGRSSPFADLPSGAIDELAAKLEPVRFAEGDELLRESEEGDDTYLIRSGEVEIVRGGSGGRVLNTLGSGAFVGDVGALTGAIRTATVRAKTPVEAFRLLGSDVRPVVAKHRHLVRRLEAAMQGRHAPRRSGTPTIAPAPDDPTATILGDSATGAYLRLTREALAIYRDLDGERTLRDLAFRHFERTGALDPQAVFATVATLQSAGLASAPRIVAEDANSRFARVTDLVIAPRLEMHDADRIATHLFRFLGFAFTPGGVAAAVGFGIVGLGALASVFREASPNDFGLGGILVAFAGLLVAGIGHEAAHALATKAGGRRVGRAGLGLLWLTPVIYVDTSDAWLIDRRRRALVNAAGPLFNFSLAGLLGLVAAWTNGPLQLIAIWLAVANLASVVFNFSPLLEFDGYYVLEDLANVNALRHKALRFVFTDLLEHPRRPRSRLEAGFVAYAAAALAYVIGVTALVLVGVPSLVDGVLADRVDASVRDLLGILVALALAAFNLGPFVSEILAARADGAP